MLTSQNIDDTVAALKGSIPSSTPLLLLSASGVQCAQLYGPSIYGSVFSPLQAQLERLVSSSSCEGSASAKEGSGTANDDETKQCGGEEDVGYISIPITDYNRGNGGGQGDGGPVDSGHWSLCILRLRRSGAGVVALVADAFCFDSLGHRNNEFVKPAIASVLAGLGLYLTSLSSDATAVVPSIDTVSVLPSPSDFPRQYSVTGCGLYICAVMEVLVGRCNGAPKDVVASPLHPHIDRLDLSTPMDIRSLVQKPFEESYRERLFTEILRI